MKNNDWRDRLNVVYSTNPDFKYDNGEEPESATLPKEKQPLRVTIDRKRRAGKTVTLISGFVGSDDDLNELCRLLKTKCGVGGSAKDNEVLIQGDLRERIIDILQKEGYVKCK